MTINQHPLLLPMLALAGWTFVVLIRLGAARIGAGLRGRLVPDDFKLGEGAGVPEDVRIPNRNYMNLLELPVLFYVVCLVIETGGYAVPYAVALAWTYVGLRVAHSLVHLTYNDVMHRLAAFSASNAVLMILWVLTVRSALA